MATQPRSPESQGPVRHPKLPVEKKKQFPWPIVALIVAAAILAAIVLTMPRAPKAKAPPAAAQVPQQPMGSQIQLSDLKISAAPTGGAFYLTGQLMNTGRSSINGIQVELDFRDATGQTLVTEKLPVEGMVPGSNPPQAQNLSEAPIKPHQERPFRIYVSQVPQGWNHQIPEMKIVTVTGART